jgi:hypothetical protein
LAGKFSRFLALNIDKISISLSMQAVLMLIPNNDHYQLPFPVIILMKKNKRIYIEVHRKNTVNLLLSRLKCSIASS